MLSVVICMYRYGVCFICNRLFVGGVVLFHSESDFEVVAMGAVRP